MESTTETFIGEGRISFRTVIVVAGLFEDAEPVL
jgi:hypothetical protein